MLRRIEELRKKPKHVRTRFAFMTAIVTTSLIAVLWLASLPSQLGQVPDFAIEANDESGGFSRAFDDVQDQFANVFGGIEESLSALNSTTTNNENTIRNEPKPTVDEPADLYEIDIEAMFTPSTSPETTAEPTATTSTTAKPVVPETSPTTEPALVSPVADSPRTIIIATSSAEVESN